MIDHWMPISGRVGLVGVLYSGGRFDEAIELGAATHADALRVLGPSHEFTLEAASNLAASHLATGSFDDAHALFEEVVEYFCLNELAEVKY